GGSGGGFTSVAVDVFPDVRLNALLVNATPRDLQTVEQLLLVIDQPRGPDRIEAAGRPRLIPVENANVNAVAAVVRQVFSDRLDSGGGGGGAPEIRPEQLLEALRGGDAPKKQEPEKMALGIDERSRSLVVRSSQPLYEEVVALVELLDRPGVEPPTATRVVSLKNTSAAALRDTLASLLGDKAKLGEAARATSGGAASGAPAGSSGGAAAQQDGGGDSERDARRQQREMMERVERFRQFQRMMERGGGIPGGPGGGRGGRGGGQRGGGEGRPPGGGQGAGR
ncbi:MAG: secretin N-terminal domain-containing protein, partial [Lacipirellulaceae bacterium]